MPRTLWPTNEIDDRLRDCVGELVEHVSGSKGVRHGNAIRFGSKGGLKADIAGPAKGRITPFDGAGKGMSPFQYIQAEMNCSFPDAVDWAANWLGMSPDYVPDPNAERIRREKRDRDRRKAEAQEKVNIAKRIKNATTILNASQDAQGTPVEVYLAARGIATPLPADIRFLAPVNGDFGAMVAVARDSDGNVRAVQRVFIQGGKKAPINPAKLTNGVMDGAAVRFPAQRGNELVIAEGPETGLSVWQAWGRETWVALGSVAKLVEILPVDRPVVIARDADEPGSQSDKALLAAIEAMIKRGVSVRVVSPPKPTKKGYDFNDALVDYGAKAVSTALETGGHVKPHYPAQIISLQEARRVVHSAFATWTEALPAYWHEKALYESELEAQVGYAA
jgi:phage/plasmid primase-like uncharacterized protein